VGENALSGGIKVWLDRFHLSAENYKPVITVTDLENEQFDVQVSIEDISDTEKLPVPISKILKEKQYENNGSKSCKRFPCCRRLFVVWIHILI